MKNIAAITLSIIAFYSSAAGAAKLLAGENLFAGQSIYSDNGQYFLTLQASDGNLVLYRAANSTPIWANFRYGGARAVVQYDHNFVVYNPTNKATWASNSQSNVTDTGTYLTVEDTGYLSLHAGNSTLLWTSNVPVACPGNTPKQPYLVCVTGAGQQYQNVIYACDLSDAYSTAAQYGYTLGPCL
jgi:hypothetical protein